MSDTFEIKESVTPTGTQASFIKESSQKLKASIEPDAHVSLDEYAEFCITGDELPSVVQFGMIRDPRLRVIRSIPVDIRRAGETYVASWEQAEEFGYGTNRSDALEDFGRTIAQLFITLNQEKDSLGSTLIDTLNLLRNHLQFRG